MTVARDLGLEAVVTETSEDESETARRGIAR
jgi:hypothetical protein